MAGPQDTGGIEFDTTDEDIEIEIDENPGDEGQDDGKGKTQQEDTRASAGNADEEDDDQNGRRRDETDEERQARRRDEGRRRRESRRQFAQQDNHIIAELTRQVQTLEKKVGEHDGKQIEMDISASVAARDRWLRHKRQLQNEKARAVDEGRGMDVVVLDDKIAEAHQNATYFENKARTTQREVEERQTRQRQGPTPEEAKANNARHFLSRHPGFDPQLRDKGSQELKKLDLAVERDGYDPATADYWIELERRVKEKGIILGQQDDEDDDPPPRRHPSDAQPRRDNGQFDKNGDDRGPPVGGKAAGGKKTIRVPAEVKKTLMEAGMWDDVPTRNKMLLEYQKNLEANKR